MYFYMLPFMLAMKVAMANGVYVSSGIQLCMWLAYVGGFAIDTIKAFKK